MLRKVVALLVMACMYFGNAYAGNTYPYKSVCPSPAGGAMWADKWAFYKCECTSYAAYKIDDQLNILSDGDIGFGNKYRQPEQPPNDEDSKKYHWSNGNNWDNAADRAGIKVDSTPIPGDVAYWNTGGGGYGHVEFVYKVSYDDNMNATEVCYQAYNGKGDHDYTDRCVATGTAGWINNPSGYIHILAHQEGVISYYFNRMDAPWSFPEQTQEEWEKIFLLVWSRYKESGNNNHQSIFEQTWYAYGGLPSGFGGGTGGSYDPGDEGQTLDGPDANVANGFRVRPVGGSWQEINFTAQPGQQLEASWFIKNKGDETIDYFECFLYRSNDLDFNHNDDHSYGREESAQGRSTYQLRRIKC